MNEDGTESGNHIHLLVVSMQGELGSGGPISLIGNTRRVGHKDDLSNMSTNGICRVCEYVVSGFHYVHCTVCNHVVHPECSTQFG